MDCLGSYPIEVIRLDRHMALLALTLTGCTYYDVSLLDSVGVNGRDAGSEVMVEASPEASSDAPIPPPSDASDAAVEDSAPDPDAAEAATCVHARPPDPPTTYDAGGEIEFVVAVHGIEMGDTDGNPGAIGFDLDSRCTCNGDGNGCIREPWASADGCDGPDGRDNMGGAFMQEMGSLFSGLSSQSWSQNCVDGLWSLVIRIRGYNGQPNDDQVRLDWFVTSGYGKDKTDPNIKPGWDGNDAWPIRTSCLIDQGGETFDLEHMKFFDEHAYVSGGVLVASLAEAEFAVGGNYTIEMVGAFITGRIEQGPLGWQLADGLMAARWKLSSILAQLARVQDPVFDQFVCMDHPVYANVKQRVCAYADMYSGVGAPSTPCDSSSVGFAFSTVPAKLGNIVIDELFGPYCAPDLDPANDTCDSLGE